MNNLFTKKDLIIISNAIHQLLDLHINADYDLEELIDRIDNILYSEN